ncbi:mannosyltransferase family protein [Luedemannella helvata]|uniref:Membrane protein n=1 Tax=Luedemannella helvata TaxID=349315 RepID=A0ABP4WQB3_9ACTN
MTDTAVEPNRSDEGEQAPPEPTRTGARAMWRDWRPSVLTGFWTWIAGLAAYAACTFVSWLPTPENEPTFYTVWEAWHGWDTDWYTLIADLGYHYDGRGPAFFPLYPMLMRLTNPILPGGSFEAGLILSALAALIALIMMHRLTAIFLGDALARRATFYLLAFPTGFFMVIAYNESLLIALALSSLYLMHRGKWAGAAILAGFASATRTGGVLLMVPFVLEYLRQHDWSPRKIRLDALWILVAPLGLVIYMIYLWRSFGDPLAFQHAQEAWFRYGAKPPWTTMGYAFRIVEERWPSLATESARNVIAIFLVFGCAVLLTLAVAGRWRLRPEMLYLTAFSFVTLLLPLCGPVQLNQPPLPGFWRYLLEAPVIFIMLARLGENFAFDRIYTMVVLSMQGIMVTTFLHEAFVA